MKVSEKDVADVAELANLELTEAERITLLRDLNSILDYVDTLGELDTSRVEALAQVSGRRELDSSEDASEATCSVAREDVLEGLRKSLPRAEALSNAPDSDGVFFRVPKVIER